MSDLQDMVREEISRRVGNESRAPAEVSDCSSDFRQGCDWVRGIFTSVELAFYPREVLIKDWSDTEFIVNITASEYEVFGLDPWPPAGPFQLFQDPIEMRGNRTFSRTEADSRISIRCLIDAEHNWRSFVLSHTFKDSITSAAIHDVDGSGALHWSHGPEDEALLAKSILSQVQQAIEKHL